MVEALVTDTIVATGQDALAILARRYPQLYVAPAVGAEVDHKLAATRGMVPAGATLGHFASSTDDELRLIQTPASPIEVIFLKNRADFETFLQIMGHKSQPVAIAPSIGAITYLGLADWGKVAEAQSAYWLSEVMIGSLSLCGLHISLVASGQIWWSSWRVDTAISPQLRRRMTNESG